MCGFAAWRVAGQGTITAPGSIAAVPVEAPLDPEEGAASLDMPLVMFYGHAGAGDNPELYKVRAALGPARWWRGIPLVRLGSSSGGLLTLACRVLSSAPGSTAVPGGPAGGGAGAESGQQRARQHLGPGG